MNIGTIDKSGRSGLLAAVAAVAVLGTITPANAQAEETRFDGVTLRVSTWGGSWRDRMHRLIGAEFERLGGEVVYVVGNPRDNLTKLINARGQEPPFDVVEVDDATRPFFEKGEFLRALDYEHLSNADRLDSRQRTPRLVGTWVTQHGLVYNGDKFEQNDIPAPEKLTDLMHPKLKGRVAFPDINVGFVVNGLVGLAVANGGDEGNIEPAFELLRKLDPAVYYKSSVDLSTQFKSGDVWAAFWQAGWAMRLDKAGVPVKLAFPKVGNKVGMAQLGWIGIVQGARNPEAAHFFINRYLDPDVQATLTRETGVVAVQPAAARELMTDPVLSRFLILDPDAVQNIYFADWDRIDMDSWVDRWNRAIAR